MNLNKYIPFREASLIYGGKEITVIGIHQFTIEIDRLQATYDVWVDTAQGQAVADIGASVSGSIQLTPSDSLSSPARLRIDDFTLPCTIKRCSYNHIKHAYCVSLYFTLNRDHVRTYIYDKDNVDEKTTSRFDILDIRDED